MTSALDGGECSAPCHGRAFTPGERTPGTHWTGGWVGPRAVLDTEDRGKILCPCWGSNPNHPVDEHRVLLISLYIKNQQICDCRWNLSCKDEMGMLKARFCVERSVP
jgi:hypothetical protein